MARDDDTPKLPARVEPLMWAHLLTTWDLPSQRAFRERIDEIERSAALSAERDPERRALLARREVWATLRGASKAGARVQLGLSLPWLALLGAEYAVGHGFGLLAALYLLPVPIAYRWARRAWSRAALAGMAEQGERPSLGRRARALGRGIGRAFGVGFGFAASLVFLQGLLSWFMTPAPTLLLELVSDAVLAVQAGVLGGVASVALAPLASPAPPEE